MYICSARERKFKHTQYIIINLKSVKMTRYKTFVQAVENDKIINSIYDLGGLYFVFFSNRTDAKKKRLTAWGLFSKSIKELESKAKIEIETEKKMIFILEKFFENGFEITYARNTNKRYCVLIERPNEKKLSKTDSYILDTTMQVFTRLNLIKYMNYSLTTQQSRQICADLRSIWRNKHYKH